MAVSVLICFFRASESLLPPVTRSLSVPDSGSVWEMQNPSSQASCTPNLQQAAQSSDFYIRCFVHFFKGICDSKLEAPVVLHHNLLLSTAWDGGSVWDLPIDSVAQAPTIEQMQQYEKAKTAKVNA